jgi:hypothetical protein
MASMMCTQRLACGGSSRSPSLLSASTAYGDTLSSLPVTGLWRQESHLSPSRLPPSLILPAFSMARQKTLSLTHTCTHTHTHTHAHTHTHHRVLQQYGQQQSCRREQQRKRRRKICWWRRPRCRRGRLRSMHRPLTCRPKLLRFSPGCVCVRVRGRAPRYLETGAAVLHVLHVGRVQRPAQWWG